jgi:hypothetical protein
MQSLPTFLSRYIFKYFAPNKKEEKGKQKKKKEKKKEEQKFSMLLFLYFKFKVTIIPKKEQLMLASFPTALELVAVSSQSPWYTYFII